MLRSTAGTLLEAHLHEEDDVRAIAMFLLCLADVPKHRPVEGEVLSGPRLVVQVSAQPAVAHHPEGGREGGREGGEGGRGGPNSSVLQCSLTQSAKITEWQCSTDLELVESSNSVEGRYWQQLLQ